MWLAVSISAWKKPAAWDSWIGSAKNIRLSGMASSLIDFSMRWRTAGRRLRGSVSLNTQKKPSKHNLGGFPHVIPKLELAEVLGKVFA